MNSGKNTMNLNDNGNPLAKQPTMALISQAVECREYFKAKFIALLCDLTLM